MKTLNVIPLLALLALFQGCAAGTLEQGEELRLKPLVDRVCDRHDRFVEADGSASVAEKAKWRRQSASFRAAFVSPTVKVAPIMDQAISVLDRHDTYVSEGDVPASTQRLALLSSANIRRTLEEATKRNE